MATYSCHRLIMGKVEIDIYCYLTADILTKVLQKCSLISPLPTIWNLSKPLNLIGCHGNQNAKFAKIYWKVFFSEAIRGMKLKLCRNVHNISFYKMYVFYCRCLCAFVTMATYSFHRLIMGKVKVGLYHFVLLFHMKPLTHAFIFHRCSLCAHSIIGIRGWSRDPGDCTSGYTEQYPSCHSQGKGSSTINHMGCGGETALYWREHHESWNRSSGYIELYISCHSQGKVCSTINHVGGWGEDSIVLEGAQWLLKQIIRLYRITHQLS